MVIISVILSGKGKVNPVHAMKADIRSRGKPSPTLNIGTGQTVSGQLDVLATIHSRKRDPSTS